MSLINFYPISGENNGFARSFFGGGLGGFGMGSRGMSSMFDVDDDAGGSFSFGGSGGMPGGMPRHPTPARQQSRSQPPTSPPSEITRPLKVSLEELYQGSVKHLKVGRRLLDGTTDEKVLEIQVYPGWKSGTKIRFPRAGNEQSHGEAQDIVFVVEEKPHSVFKREGNDLVCQVPIPLVEALAASSGGGRMKKTVEMLDGRKLQIPEPLGVVKPGRETVISGEGMPIRKDGSVRKKGDLIVKWNVIFPDRLTPAQQEGIRKVLG